MDDSITAGSLSNEISAINHFQTCGFKRFERRDTTALKKLIRSIKLEQAAIAGRSDEQSAKYPIDRKLLHKMLKLIPPTSLDRCVIRTALCMARSCMLRCKEYAINNGYHHSSQKVVRLGHIDHKHLKNNKLIFNIKKSKCNPFWFNEITGTKCECNRKNACCAIHELKKLLEKREELDLPVTDSVPLFKMSNGNILSTSVVNKVISNSSITTRP